MYGVLFVKDGIKSPFLGCTKNYMNKCPGRSLNINDERAIVEKWFNEGRDFKSKYKYDPKTFKKRKTKNYK